MVTQTGSAAEFRFFRPDAHHVWLVGDFNNWNLTELPMTRCLDGWWTCRLGMVPGCYQFRYLSDGEWFLDYAAFGLDHGPFGLNSVVIVEAAPASQENPVAAARREKSPVVAAQRNRQRATAGIPSAGIRLGGTLATI